jgi:hypothetical protein
MWEFVVDVFFEAAGSIAKAFNRKSTAFGTGAEFLFMAATMTREPIAASVVGERA